VFKMFRRFLWLIVGFALGASSSWAVTRRVRRAARRYVPSQVRDRWSENMRAAVSEGRVAMRTREAELKGSSPGGPGK
jgi:hypothetical protein